jgi:hypothetical protein
MTCIASIENSYKSSRTRFNAGFSKFVLEHTVRDVGIQASSTILLASTQKFSYGRQEREPHTRKS